MGLLYLLRTYGLGCLPREIGLMWHVLTWVRVRYHVTVVNCEHAIAGLARGAVGVGVGLGWVGLVWLLRWAVASFA